MPFLPRAHFIGTSLAMKSRMAQEHTHDPKDGPLDGSTSGTIGGGGPETGGPTERPKAPDMPPAHPENAATGRSPPSPAPPAVDAPELTPGPHPVSYRSASRRARRPPVAESLTAGAH